MRGSKAVVGFWLVHVLGRPELVGAAAAGPVRARGRAATLRVVEGATYPLSEARRAHEDMQARRTTGKLVLDPRR